MAWELQEKGWGSINGGKRRQQESGCLRLDEIQAREHCSPIFMQHWAPAYTYIFGDSGQPSRAGNYRRQLTSIHPRS